MILDAPHAEPEVSKAEPSLATGIATRQSNGDAAIMGQGGVEAVAAAALDMAKRVAAARGVARDGIMANALIAKQLNDPSFADFIAQNSDRLAQQTNISDILALHPDLSDLLAQHSNLTDFEIAALAGTRDVPLDEIGHPDLASQDGTHWVDSAHGTARDANGTTQHAFGRPPDNRTGPPQLQSSPDSRPSAITGSPSPSGWRQPSGRKSIPLNTFTPGLDSEDIEKARNSPARIRQRRLSQARARGEIPPGLKHPPSAGFSKFLMPRPDLAPMDNFLSGASLSLDPNLPKPPTSPKPMVYEKLQPRHFIRTPSSPVEKPAIANSADTVRLRLPRPPSGLKNGPYEGDGPSREAHDTSIMQDDGERKTAFLSVELPATAIPKIVGGMDGQRRSTANSSGKRPKSKARATDAGPTTSIFTGIEDDVVPPIALSDSIVWKSDKSRSSLS